MPTNPPTRRDRHRGGGAAPFPTRRLAAALSSAALACTLLTLPAPIQAAQPRAALPLQPSSPTWSTDAATLRDKSATAALRSSACRQLLASLDPAARQYLLRLLTPTTEDPDARDLIVRELGQLAASPDWALPAMIELLAAAPAEKRPELLRSMACIRTRDAIRAVLVYTRPTNPQDVRDAAFACLRRLSGRVELGSDEARWSDWFAGVEWLPDPEWRRVLAEGLAQYAQSMTTQRDALLTRLLESERRRCLDAPTEQDRWNILASFLKDELPALRKLGIELTNRELANARQPGRVVAQAALGLLSDPSVELRINGADLIDRLQPDDPGLAISQALTREQDARVLPHLLRQVERWPTADARPVVLTLIDDPEPVGPAAMRALAALLDAGLLTQDQDQARALAVLRAVDLRLLDAPALRLLCELGSDQDRTAAGTLLEDPSPQRRLNAAVALAHRPAWIDPVVQAALKDPGLFAVASAMIADFRATPDGFMLLARLPATTPDGQPAPTRVREAMLSLADTFSPSELLTVAARITDLDLREAILARLTAIPLGAGALPFPVPRESQGNVVVSGLMLLAQTRLDAHRPAAALAVLDTLGAPGVTVDESAYASLRAQALIGLNRLADAIEVGAPPAAWILALSEVIDLPHAPSVLAVMDANFRGDLTPEQEQAVETVRSILAERHPIAPSTPDESRPRRTLPGPIR